MNMRNLAAIMFCLLSFSSVWAKGKSSKLVIVFNDNTTSQFNLSDSPRVVFHQDSTYVSYQDYVVSFCTNDLKTFEFAESENNAFASATQVMEVDDTGAIVLVHEDEDGKFRTETIKVRELKSGRYDFVVGKHYSLKLQKK